ncbi:hypothetical protein FA13DRAFT_1784917 [Coprinellus micaceus]|uniref:Uncharacterized protein n=1 Tax=Coprinellus micaceus TaxID=71717 RepID=A0A4Y7TYE7_COPMI|nr:hypothetical protein FA13DRAFT_1784917 [Coprinellus micaceus]
MELLVDGPVEEIARPESHPIQSGLTQAVSQQLREPPSRVLNDDMMDIDLGVSNECQTLTTLTIQLFDHPKDWHPIKEIVYYTTNGDISLGELHTQLECEEGFEVHILDPRRYRPFHNYQPDIVVAADVEDLVDNGYIRTICRKKKARTER